MDTLLAGIEGMGAYLDDIMVTKATQEEHLERSALLYYVSVLYPYYVSVLCIHTMY